ncbi:MAG: hypothetical protein ACQER9_02380 [Nanobdellota archaeon]
MAYQRAVINCEICYEECKEGQENTRIDEKPEAHQARNEALKALEHQIEITHREIIVSGSDEHTKDVISSVRSRAYQAMDNCMNCDYKEPYIANHYREQDDEAV